MVKESGDVFLSIQTWEDNDVIRVGFQFGTEGEQIQEPITLTREEARLLLALEEDCQ